MSAPTADPDAPVYETIGTGYSAVRRPDPRIAAAIEAALGEAVSVVNVGAGAGSYESPNRKLLAVEPSELMIRQRASDAAPAILGSAEALPLADASVDACTAFLTVHHWRDQPRGLAEMRRVARKRVVVMTYVPFAIPATDRWLTSRYFPEIQQADDRVFPPASLYTSVLGPVRMEPLLVPADCTDGFLDAYWCRPERYLLPEVRMGISAFRLLAAHDVARGLARLKADLASGEWDRQFGELRSRAALDVGFRLVIADIANQGA